MGLFVKSIKEQISHCKENRSALKVARKITTVGDCIDFIEACPSSCNEIGEEVLKLINDDRALFKIVMSDTVNSYLRHKAFDKLDSSYYPDVLDMAGGKLSMDMKQKIKQSMDEEKRKKLEKDVSTSDDTQYLFGIVNAPNQDSHLLKKAILRLLELYKKQDQNYDKRVIELFSVLPNYVDDALNQVFSPETLLEIAKTANLLDYKRYAIYRVLYVGYHRPMKKAYKLGLTEEVYHDVIKLICEYYYSIPEDMIELLAMDGDTLRTLWKTVYSKKTKLDVLSFLVKHKYLSGEEMLNEYGMLKLIKTLEGVEDTLKVMRTNFCNESLELREKILLSGKLDMAGYETVLGSLKRNEDEKAKEIELKCAKYLLDHPDTSEFNLGYWYYSIANVVSPENKEKLGVEIIEDEYEEEDQFGRYTTSTYDVTYEGETYHSVNRNMYNSHKYETTPEKGKYDRALELSSEKDNDKLLHIAIDKAEEENVRKMAFCRLIANYQDKMEEKPDNIGYVISMFVRMNEYYPDLLFNIYDTELLLTICQFSYIMNYSLEAFRGIVKSGIDMPVPEAYKMGLEKRMYYSLLREFAEISKVIQYEDFLLFENDREALEYIHKARVPYYDEAAMNILIMKHYSTDELIDMYQKVLDKKDDKSINIKSDINIRLSGETLENKRNAILCERLDFNERYQLFKMLQYEEREDKDDFIMEAAKGLLDNAPEEIHFGNLAYGIYTVMKHELAERIGLRYIILDKGASRIVYNNEQWVFEI